MNFKILLFLLVSLFSQLNIATELKHLSPEQLLDLQKNNALVVDIRTEKEWVATGVIPDSYKLQFFDNKGQYDTKKWLEQLKKQRVSENQPIILVCRSGQRSSMVGNFLTQQAGMDNIYHLQKGMNFWLKQGQTTKKDCLNKLACN